MTQSEKDEVPKWARWVRFIEYSTATIVLASILIYMLYQYYLG